MKEENKVQMQIFGGLSPKLQSEVVACGVYFLDIMLKNDLTVAEFEGMVEARNLTKGNLQ